MPVFKDDTDMTPKQLERVDRYSTKHLQECCDKNMKVDECICKAFNESKSDSAEENRKQGVRGSLKKVFGLSLKRNNVVQRAENSVNGPLVGTTHGMSSSAGGKTKTAARTRKVHTTPLCGKGCGCQLPFKYNLDAIEAAAKGITMENVKDTHREFESQDFTTGSYVQYTPGEYDATELLQKLEIPLQDEQDSPQFDEDSQMIDVQFSQKFDEKDPQMYGTPIFGTPIPQSYESDPIKYEKDPIKYEIDPLKYEKEPEKYESDPLKLDEDPQKYEQDVLVNEVIVTPGVTDIAPSDKISKQLKRPDIIIQRVEVNNTMPSNSCAPVFTSSPEDIAEEHSKEVIIMEPLSQVPSAASKASKTLFKIGSKISQKASKISQKISRISQRKCAVDPDDLNSEFSVLEMSESKMANTVVSKKPKSQGLYIYDEMKNAK